MAANDWLRLWHDMPNDPKWRTISRVSGQSISVVVATYIHLLVDASRNVTRGHVDVTAEDIASALDLAEDAVQSVLSAMQGRVIDGDFLTGWAARQPKKEDRGNPETGAKSAAERKQAQREREKSATGNRDNDDESSMSHEVTKCHAREDKSKEVNTPHTPLSGGVTSVADAKKKTVSLQTFLAGCKASGEKPIPEDDAVFTFASSVGIPHEFLQLAWLEFKSRYGDGSKRYKDWRSVFRKAVRGNWFKLWFVGEQGIQLSSQGKLLQNAHREAA